MHHHGESETAIHVLSGVTRWWVGDRLDDVREARAGVFPVVYVGEVLLNTGLGLYSPTQWSAKDVAVDVVDKYVQAQATGLVFERVLDPRS